MSATDTEPCPVAIVDFHYQGRCAAAALRGSSQRPLFVTARGMPAADAACLGETVHGEHRIPTLIARVDHLARGRA